jgi:hypothetical protein
LGVTAILGKHGGGPSLREPLSGCGIPANRENNWDYLDIWLFRLKLVVETRAFFGRCLNLAKSCSIGRVFGEKEQLRPAERMAWRTASPPARTANQNVADSGIPSIQPKFIPLWGLPLRRAVVPLTMRGIAGDISKARKDSR